MTMIIFMCVIPNCYARGSFHCSSHSSFHSSFHSSYHPSSSRSSFRFTPRTSVTTSRNNNLEGMSVPRSSNYGTPLHNYYTPLHNPATPFHSYSYKVNTTGANNNEYSRKRQSTQCFIGTALND